MEFAWNTQKNKISDVKGKEMEQDRKGRKSNPDIDDTRTNMNYDLVESDKTLYQRVKERVDEVRSVSRIQKNSVVDFSNIITVPKEQYEKWGLEKSKDYLKEVYNYFCMEFGKENVVSAKIHLDETTPHMHLHFVPVNQENGKLQARALMTPARINKIHTEAPKYLQERGFEVERGKGKTEKSIDIHRYKAEKLKEDINILENKLKALEGDLKAIQVAKGQIEHLGSIDIKKSHLGTKISLKEDDFNLLMELAKGNIKRVAEIEKLQRELERTESKSSGLGDENKKLKGEIKNLKLDNIDLQKKLNKVVKQAQCLRDSIDEHSDSENILANVREKFNAPEQKQEIKPKNKNMQKSNAKSYEIGD